jgi:poly-beta-1,6-N-acetyl-D-glucosamine biosynthesis protein PgaD
MSTERPWPPLIVAARIPFWIKVRDRVLTCLMWGLFLTMLVEEADIVVTRHSFSVTIGWLDMRQELFPFVMLAATLATLLFAASQFTRRRRRLTLLLPQPPALTLTDHAARARVAEDALSRAREHRIVVIHVDADRKLRFEPR